MYLSNKYEQLKGVMMVARIFLRIGVIMIMSLFGAQAFAAGVDDYAPTATKPAAYNNALVLIKNKSYDEAIVKLKQAESAAKKDADIQNLLGLLIASRASWTPQRNIINLRWHSIQGIRVPWNIKVNCF